MWFTIQGLVFWGLGFGFVPRSFSLGAVCLLRLHSGIRVCKLQHAGRDALCIMREGEPLNSEPLTP